MWQSVVNGQELKFRLAGINNQNFIMRDEQTGSWWQQISGEAIQGKFKGQRLENVPADEITFAVFKRENPNGRVLEPENEKIEDADWEAQVGKMPVRISGDLDNTLDARTLIVGINVNGKAKAYPFSAIEKQSPILDLVGGKNIAIFLAEDKKSVRVFERETDGKVLEFLRKTDSNEIVDAETGSVWDFSGKATSGEFSGKQLRKINSIKDYWFDWKTYNPETQLYDLGVR